MKIFLYGSELDAETGVGGSFSYEPCSPVAEIPGARPVFRGGKTAVEGKRGSTLFGIEAEIPDSEWGGLVAAHDQGRIELVELAVTHSRSLWAISHVGGDTIRPDSGHVGRVLAAYDKLGLPTAASHEIHNSCREVVDRIKAMTKAGKAAPCPVCGDNIVRADLVAGCETCGKRVLAGASK